jgi:hypothetical protein
VQIEQLEAAVKDKGYFQSRLEIHNPALRAFMCLKDGQKAYHDIRVSSHGCNIAM